MAGTKQPKAKAHSYFANHRPSEWNLTTFLDKESVRRGAHFDFPQALNSWNSSLRHLASFGSGGQVAAAEQKIIDYYKASPGNLSDKTRAGNWRKERRLNPATPRPSLAPVSSSMPPQNNYYGPVITGAVHRPTITSNVNNSGGVLVDAPVNTPADAPVDAPAASSQVRENSDVGSSRNDVVAKPSLNVGIDVDVDEERLRSICLSLRELRSHMADTFRLPSGQVLEDYLLQYALGLTQLDPAHCFIVDKRMLSMLDVVDSKRILSQVQPLPVFPGILDSLLEKYKGVTTVAQCIEVAKISLEENERWINRVLEHMVRLITNGILLLDLGEGMLDSLVNPVFWDCYFIDIPGLIIQRKEISLSAMKHEPYQYLNYDPHFDGVVRTRSQRSHDAYELGLFEVSSQYGKITKSHEVKWDKDRTKLIAGCRAMLYRLKELVDDDANTVKKLRVVGVLQAGLRIQLFIMSFINSNVLHLREGTVWELPKTFESLDQVFNVITIVWKAKKMIADTETAVRNYLGGTGADRLNADFV